MASSNTLSETDQCEVVDLLYQLSGVLNCGIDKQTVAIIVNMVEAGISPVAISSIVKEIRNESLANS